MNGSLDLETCRILQYVDFQDITHGCKESPKIPVNENEQNE